MLTAVPIGDRAVTPAIDASISRVSGRSNNVSTSSDTPSPSISPALLQPHPPSGWRYAQHPSPTSCSPFVYPIRPASRRTRYRQMSCGRTGTRRIGRPVAWRIAAAIAGVTEMHGGSPTPLAPSGACGSGSSISVATTSGVSSAVGQQVVGEARVADLPSVEDDLLHHRQAEALGDAAFDLALASTAG